MCPYGCRLRGLINRDLAQQLEVAQHLSRAQHHAAQRIIGNGNRQPGFLANALVEILHQRAPPVSTMPRSLMSADSSGGVRSSATRIAFMMVEIHSLSDSRISLSSIVMVLGTPSMRLRPLISMVSGFSSG